MQRLQNRMIFFLLKVSDDVVFDKRLVRILNRQLQKVLHIQKHKEKHIMSMTWRFYGGFETLFFIILWYALMNKLSV